MLRRRKDGRKRKLGLTIAVIILLLAGVAVIMVWKVFVVQKVEVVGNKIYTDEQIETWALNDDYSWSSLYVVLKNKFFKEDDIPFVDSMDISLKSPQSIEITVTEKGILGYVYIPTLDRNAYIDKDGYVVELSEDVIEDVPKIIGIVLTKEPTLYEKIAFKNTNNLKTLLSLTQLLKRYDTMPEKIVISGTDVILVYGDIQVSVGSGTNLSDKIQRMVEILPKLKGKYGMLHLDTWSENSTDIYFKQYEKVELPEDEGAVIETSDDEEVSEEETTEDTKDSEAEDTDQETTESQTSESSSSANGTTSTESSGSSQSSTTSTQSTESSGTQSSGETSTTGTGTTSTQSSGTTTSQSTDTSDGQSSTSTQSSGTASDQTGTSTSRSTGSSSGKSSSSGSSSSSKKTDTVVERATNPNAKIVTGD